MRLWRYVVSIFLLFSLFGCTSSSMDENAITYTLRVVELDQSVLVEKVIEGTPSDVLLEVLKNNFEVVSAESQWGTYLISIEGSSTGDNLFLAIYVNGEMAAVGISGLIPHDGDVFEFKVESFA